MLEFPHALLREAVTDRPRLVGSARTGGRSASGAITMSRADGGGLWFYGLLSIAITNRELVMIYEAMVALMAEGARPIIVPICDKRHSPGWSVGGGAIINSYGKIPHSDTALFSDTSGYTQQVVDISMGADAPLRSPTIVIRLLASGPLIGGELFSINHTTLGPRWYRVTTVAPDTPSPGLVTIGIEPPLREATGAGIGLDFDYPRCVMQLAEPAPLQLELRRSGKPSMNFVESFLPPD